MSAPSSPGYNSAAVAALDRPRRSRHGAYAVVGEVVWLAFLAGTFALLVTITIGVMRVTRSRRAAN